MTNLTHEVGFKAGISAWPTPLQEGGGGAAAVAAGVEVMLDLEVIPERSLGNEQWQFVLGMPFHQAVEILKRQCRVIKSVQVLYSETNPLSVDLILNLNEDGVRLIFDPVVQRLKIIEVYDLNKLKLRYCGVHFSVPSPTVPPLPPSIEQIDSSFGATHPGVFNAEKQIFLLNFRGLSFTFPIQSEFEPRFSRGLGSLPFPAGSSPTVSKMCIYAGNNFNDTRAPALPTLCMHGQTFLETLHVIRVKRKTKGIQLFLVTDEPGPGKLSEIGRRSFERRVYFGDTAQEVLSALGCPSREFFKAEDKMKIHSPGAYLKSANSCGSDYFFNYFTLGLDILFDASHRVKKFVLHTNFPGHYDFNIYHRCEFSLPLTLSSKDIRKDQKDTSLGSCRGAGGAAGDAPALTVRPYTKWNQVQEYLSTSSSSSPSSRHPVILNRASTTNTTNPFGATFCYGVQDIIFEIIQNNYIASVILYRKGEGTPKRAE